MRREWRDSGKLARGSRAQILQVTGKLTAELFDARPAEGSLTNRVEQGRALIPQSIYYAPARFPPSVTTRGTRVLDTWSKKKPNSC